MLYDKREEIAIFPLCELGGHLQKFSLPKSLHPLGLRLYCKDRRRREVRKGNCKRFPRDWTPSSFSKKVIEFSVRNPLIKTYLEHFFVRDNGNKALFAMPIILRCTCIPIHYFTVD